MVNNMFNLYLQDRYYIIWSYNSNDFELYV